MSFVQLARYTIGLMWIYQGLFPKLLHIAPLEMQISGSIGLSPTMTFWFIKLAGVAEILFGILFIQLYERRQVVLLNMLALVGLLLFTALMTPHILIEAFNPVTTNIPLLLLSYYLLLRAKSH